MNNVYSAQPRAFSERKHRIDKKESNIRVSISDYHSEQSDDLQTEERLKNSIMEYEGIDVELNENDSPNLILYKYRWVVLFSFFWASVAIGCVIGSLDKYVVKRLGESSFN
jgi:hypothetical protein